MNRCLLLISVVLFGIVVLDSCGVYSHKDRMRRTFLKTYDLSDSLFLSDIICFGVSAEGFRFQNINVDRDSLAKIFITSLAELNLPIIINSDKISIHNKRCLNGDYVRKKHIDFDCLNKLNRRNNKEYIILPIIELMFSKLYNTGAAGSDVSYYVSLLSISIFIFKNDEVIYYKQMSYAESVDRESHAYLYSDFHIPIPKEYWDGLIRKVMKEYIERLK